MAYKSAILYQPSLSYNFWMANRALVLIHYAESIMEFFFSLLTTFTLKVHTTLEIKSKLNPVTFSLFKFTFVLPVYILCSQSLISTKYNWNQLDLFL